MVCYCASQVTPQKLVIKGVCRECASAELRNQKCFLYCEITQSEVFDPASTRTTIESTFGVKLVKTLLYAKEDLVLEQGIIYGEDLTNELQSDIQEAAIKGVSLIFVKATQVTRKLEQVLKAILDKGCFEIVLVSVRRTRFQFSLVEFFEDDSYLELVEVLNSFASSGTLLATKKQIEKTRKIECLEKAIEKAEAMNLVKRVTFHYKLKKLEVFSVVKDLDTEVVKNVLSFFKKSRLKAYLYRIKNLLEEVYDLSVSEEKILQILRNVPGGELSFESSQEGEIYLYQIYGAPKSTSQMSDLQIQSLSMVIQGLLETHPEAPQGLYSLCLFLLFDTNKAINKRFISEIYEALENLYKDGMNARPVSAQSLKKVYSKQQEAQFASLSEIKPIVVEHLRQAKDEVELTLLKDKVKFTVQPKVLNLDFLGYFNWKQLVGSFESVKVRNDKARLKEINADEENCAICIEEIEGLFKTSLKCGHIYHIECIRQWFRYNDASIKYCPCCRDRVCESIIQEILNEKPKSLKFPRNKRDPPRPYWSSIRSFRK